MHPDKAVLPLVITVFIAVHCFLDLGKFVQKGCPVHVLFLLQVLWSHCGQEATINVSLWIWDPCLFQGMLSRWNYVYLLLSSYYVWESICIILSVASQLAAAYIERKVICYQLELRKQLVDISTKCSSHHEGENETVQKTLLFIAMHY